MMLPRHICLLTIFGLSLALPAAKTGYCSDSRNRTGVITGRVTDSLGGSPLAGASVVLSGTSLGAAADTAGRFEIQNIPPGRYNVNIRRIAYQPKTVADIAVAPDRVTHIDVRLSQMPVEIDEIVVRGRYHPWVSDPSPPSVMISSGEIRGVPGALSDVTRVINLHPGVAKVGEVTNVQVVRGGTPGENGFYLDGIEVSNLNHFPIQGSSAGLMGLVNADFIEQASFYPGGFSAEYGDRLSSITEIAYREGTREGFAGNFSLHVAGFGLAAEGSLAGGRGSWLFSGRRSFLDVFADAIGVGNAPGYSDCQGKAVYDLSSSHTLSFLVIAGADDFSLGRETSEEDDKPEYGDWSGYQYTAGAIWRFDRPEGGYSMTSLAILGLRTRWYRYFTSDGIEEASEDSYERAVQLRHVSCRRFGPMVEVASGIALAELNSDFGLYTGSFWNPLGGSIPSMTVREKVHATRAGLFAALRIAPLSDLVLSVGARLDHFDYTDRAHLSPRFSFSIGISDGTVLTGGTGVYHQSLPLALLAQHDRHKELADPRATHYVLGIRHSWSETVSFLMETYLKAYDRMPMDSALPQLFVLDELVRNEYMGHHLRLADGERPGVMASR